MPQSALFTGIIPPVSTIFTADGQLDKSGTAALIGQRRRVLPAQRRRA